MKKAEQKCENNENLCNVTDRSCQTRNDSEKSRKKPLATTIR